MNILADNLNRFIGPGKPFASNEAVAAASGVGRSTIDRARKAEVSLRVDNIGQIAKAFGVEPWELLHPALEPKSRPSVNVAGVTWPLEGVAPADYALVDPEEREEVSDLARSKVKRHKARSEPPTKSPNGAKAAA